MHCFWKFNFMEYITVQRLSHATKKKKQAKTEFRNVTNRLFSFSQFFQVRSEPTVFPYPVWAHSRQGSSRFNFLP